MSYIDSHYGRRHLKETGMDTISYSSRANNHTHASTLFNFTLSGTMIYKMSTALYWRSCESSDGDHKLIRKLWTQLINQGRSRIIFS